MERGKREGWREGWREGEREGEGNRGKGKGVKNVHCLALNNDICDRQLPHSLWV